MTLGVSPRTGRPESRRAGSCPRPAEKRRRRRNPPATLWVISDGREIGIVEIPDAANKGSDGSAASASDPFFISNCKRFACVDLII